MKARSIRAIAASTLTAAMVFSMSAQTFAQGMAKKTGEHTGNEVDWTQAPPLLITEVATDQASGKRYTYTEVYNNSDEPINLSDYTYFYTYQSGMGSGKVFEPTKWGSAGEDVIRQPGKALVL